MVPAMSLSAWLAGRQARELIRNGRFEAAAKLLEPLAVAGYRRALAAQRGLAQAYLDRAAHHLTAGEIEAAWADMHAAERLVPGPAGSPLRPSLVQASLTSISEALTAGQPVRALDAADRLRVWGSGGRQLTALTESAQAWVNALDAADRGQFPQALEHICTAAGALPDGPARATLERTTTTLAARADQFTAKLAEATSASAAGQFATVVQATEAALGCAPNHAELKALRTQAWAALQPGAESMVPLARLAVLGSVAAGVDQHETTYFHSALSQTPASDSATPQSGSDRRSSLLRSGTAHQPGTPLPKRFMLWVDGVGGYLVCLGSRVAVGQAIGDAPVDVPLFAELAKLHAEISRDADGGYVLEASRDAQVNGAAIKRTVLTNGDRVTLGASCQLLFHRPVAISATARLDVVSGHRLPWAVDGVLLMDQTLILGGPGGGHVPGADSITQAVILHRTAAGLAIKCAGRFEVSDRPCQDRAELPLPGVVRTEALTFALDPVGR